mgnify:FL=1
MAKQSAFDTGFRPLWTISFWNFWPGHLMKKTGRMKVSTVEDRRHYFKYCIPKICYKIIVRPLAIKINPSTKNDPIKHSTSAELSLSEIHLIQKFRTRK